MDEVPVVPIETPNTYEFKLTILKNDVISVNINSSNTTSKWFNMVLATVFGAVIIAAAFGDKLVNLYRMIVGG
ncbi:hypothetical protein M0R04_04370 [Candidatus Dojkabacteria bacterium]|jgi:hypothetical protein|nr:hypothetical protein [Candidatus Dojkabacteria bacterium]